MSEAMEQIREQYLDSLGEINERIEAVKLEACKNGFTEVSMNRLKGLLESRDDMIYAIKEMDRN